MNVFALLPAAGLSKRMGTEKLRLPIDGQPVLTRLIRVFRAAGVEKILAVLGPSTADLADVVQTAGGRALTLPEPTQDMQETVQKGLAWINANWHPLHTDAFFLSPADFPAITPAIVRQLKEVLDQHQQILVVKPVHEGKRGHPVLCRWELANAMLNAAPGTGLNHVLAQYREATVTLDVATPRVLMDMDTPEDYDQARVSMNDPETKHAFHSE